MRLQTLRRQVDLSGIGTYTYVCVYRVHRTIDSSHFLGPSLHIRQFRVCPFFHLYCPPSDEICRVLDVYFVAERELQNAGRKGTSGIVELRKNVEICVSLEISL